MIAVVIEHDRGALSALSLEALTYARRVAETTGDALHAIVIGRAARPLTERVAAYGVSTVHLVDADRLDDYVPGAWAASVATVVAAEHPRVVMAAGSDRGNELMASVAARLGLPMAANCSEVQPGDPCRITRQRWGGSLLEDATLEADVALCTIAPHAHVAESVPAPGGATVKPGAPPGAIVKTIAPDLTNKDFRARLVSRVEAAGDKVALAEARVVIGGGRGVGSPEGFTALEELAALLGGAIGCSRAVTSAGWRPHAEQVGQTGTRIAPDLYVACGISGAIQHMIGCKGAKHVLAINTDADAPMVTKADYAVIADLHRVVPAISAALRNATGR